MNARNNEETRKYSVSVEQLTDNVVSVSPGVHIYGIQNSQKRKAPWDTFDDSFVAGFKELVDDCPKKQ
jgi:hypothetical protein